MSQKKLNTCNKVTSACSDSTYFVLVTYDESGVLRYRDTSDPMQDSDTATKRTPLNSLRIMRQDRANASISFRSSLYLSMTNVRGNPIEVALVPTDGLVLVTRFARLQPVWGFNSLAIRCDCDVTQRHAFCNWRDASGSIGWGSKQTKQNKLP